MDEELVADGLSVPQRRPTESPAARRVESRLTEVGQELAHALNAAISSLPRVPHSTVQLAQSLGVDKVLASRLMKACRSGDPIATLHAAPGPEPLRRVLRAAARRGSSREATRRAHEAVDRFDNLIRLEGGDRGGLDGIISSWIPEARKQFELRNKQLQYKAISQIRGLNARVTFATSILHPARSRGKLDVAWVFGELGLYRCWPGAPVKLATKRMVDAQSPRRPLTLDGLPIESKRGLLLEEFCSKPTPALEAKRFGDAVHYVLMSEEFGPNASVDLAIAEANYDEMEQILPERGRKGFVFTCVTIPSKTLVLDVLLHDDVYPGTDPSLYIYDMSFEGIANVNDRAREMDLLCVQEHVFQMGHSIANFRCSVIPNYLELLRTVFERLGWDDSSFRGYRCKIDYPILNSQIALAFAPGGTRELKRH